MAVTMGQMMRSCRNFFERGQETGAFSIAGNALSPVPDAPWVSIGGSAYHDGVWKLTDGVLDGAEGLPDEDFTGWVWLLYPPRDFLALLDEVNAYEEKNPTGSLKSENFGPYSYTRASAENGTTVTWQEAYAKRLIPYRRMFTEVE